MTNIEANKRLFNKVAEHYDWSIIKYWMKRFNQSVLSLDFKNSDKVLDISCGTGELLWELQQRGLTKLYGIDLSENMLRKAKEKIAKEERPKVNLRQGDVHKLPYPDNSFDCVISTEAFHHYHDQKKALSEMKRVCKEKGRVIIVDIDFFMFNKLFQKLEPACVKINDKPEMLHLFETTGLKECRQKKDFLFSFMTMGTK